MYTRYRNLNYEFTILFFEGLTLRPLLEHKLSTLFFSLKHPQFCSELDAGQSDRILLVDRYVVLNEMTLPLPDIPFHHILASGENMRY